MRRPRGFALPLVLWVAILFAAGAASLASRAGNDVRDMVAARDVAVARLAADAGVDLAIARYLTDGTTTSFACRFADAAIAVDIVDEAGRIDLNLAPPDLLTGLLRALGIDPAVAAGLARRTVDDRDPNDTALDGGPEDAPGSGVDTHDMPFATVEAWARVPGVTPELLAAARPALTVHSGLPGVDVTVAGPLVRTAVAIWQRDAAGTVFPVVGARSQHTTYGVTATARLDEGASFVRQAVVRLDPDRPPGFRVLRWRRAGAARSLARGLALEPCARAS